MGTDDETRQLLDTNRRFWDAATPVHVASEFYDLAGVRAGADRLAAFEYADLGDLTGLDVAHLQCHIGTDTLCLARAGAHAVGLDFSQESVTQARTLAGEVGLPVEYVQADVHDAVDVLGAGRFDLVYTGKGSLVWLPDLDRWARVVADLLKPGGALYLVEFHPITWAVAEDSPADALRIGKDYLAGDRAVEVVGDHTYTDGPPVEGGPGKTFEWSHDIGEVVTAVARAGLRVESLGEYDVLPWNPWPGMVPAADGWWRLPDGAPRVPLTYALRATKAP